MSKHSPGDSQQTTPHPTSSTAPPSIRVELVAQLGGPQKGDPVVWGRNLDGTIGVLGWMGGVLVDELRRGATIPIEPAMPALLRMLARKVGLNLAPGEAPAWREDFKGRWWLTTVTGPAMSTASSAGNFVPSLHVFTPPAHAGDRYTCAHTSVPALSERRPRLEALGVVLAFHSQEPTS